MRSTTMAAPSLLVPGESVPRFAASSPPSTRTAVVSCRFVDHVRCLPHRTTERPDQGVPR
jgi:hypothetical protein